MSVAREIVIIGDKQVGKTALFRRRISNDFSEQYKPTSGSTTLDAIWDTGGQEDFVKKIIKFADVVIIAYDITRRETFENAKGKWLAMARQYAPGKPIILVGTKSDLEDQRQVTNAEALGFGRDALYIIETSAKTDKGIVPLFFAAVPVALAAPQPAATTAVQAEQPASPAPRLVQGAVLDREIASAPTHWQKHRSVYIGLMVFAGVIALAAAAYFLLPIIIPALIVGAIVGAGALKTMLAAGVALALILGLTSASIDHYRTKPEPAPSELADMSHRSSTTDLTVGMGADKVYAPSEPVATYLSQAPVGIREDYKGAPASDLTPKL